MQHKRYKPVLLDYILLALIGGGILYFYWQLENELQYEWSWETIPQFLLKNSNGTWEPNFLLEGLFTTIRLSIWATLLASVVGVLMGLARVSQSHFGQMISRTYVEIVRNMPPIVLIFISYFFLSAQLTQYLSLDTAVQDLPPWLHSVISIVFCKPSQVVQFVTGVITLGLYEGAYITEIVRGGVNSVQRGQWEASASLGFNRFDQLRLVVLPQALKVIIPPLAGQFISTIKDSAILSVISIQELTFQGLELMASTYLVFEIWITIAMMYLLLTLGCSILSRWVERALVWKN
ncbi:amino acid ABC transporter permease [Halodesulfovibrio marinisediminis]|uniref:Amino acid ABC transporter membrane protein 2, PAAT family n=1 Tax=Halodesulfovibrio marinisediminis DSM 17456 TaxID=1121457 RepID=A0A1N6FX57_9BACT|nr:amino acid ABC transporter permease [Halodesulfovibrio marinisediminis]SIN99833.1 amino acid ABC transporter membrane protein 2, PAAT family [Halodesulfovibrio marinisediminis DSM 17456]